MTFGYAHSTGIRVEANRKFNAPLPDFDGRHVWVATAMWHLANPAASKFTLDVENMITLIGPQCFHCEQPWKPTIGSKCPGDPYPITDLT